MKRKHTNHLNRKTLIEDCLPFKLMVAAGDEKKTFSSNINIRIGIVLRNTWIRAVIHLIKKIISLFRFLAAQFISWKQKEIFSHSNGNKAMAAETNRMAHNQRAIAVVI